MHRVEVGFEWLTVIYIALQASAKMEVAGSTWTEAAEKRYNSGSKPDY